MTRYSTLLFDLDGTLTDPGSGIVRTIRSVLSTMGIKPPPPEELKWCVGPPLRKIFERLLEHQEVNAGGAPAAKAQMVEQAAALYLHRYAESGAAESVVYQGVVRMLTELQTSARLFVVTSKNTATAERILGMCGLRRHFADVIGNGRLEDKSDMVRELIERERVAHSAAAIVGDREHDIIAGKRNGISTIGVTYGYGSREELAAAGADSICESPAEITKALLSEHIP
jgi:phosphoglycolate phosphatase